MHLRRISTAAALLGLYYIGYLHGAGAGTPVPAFNEEKLDSVTHFTCEGDGSMSVVLESAEPAAIDGSVFEKLSALQEQFQLLKDKQSRDALTAEQRLPLPGLFKQALSQLPLDLVVSQIDKYAGISAATLEQMPDKRAFVNRLVEVAMEGILTEADENKQDLLGPIRFSDQYADGGEVSWFSSRVVTVFASFDTVVFDKPVVLVKWYRSDDDKILLFKQMPINRQNTNYIWTTSGNGTEPGHYKVDIYDISSEMSLLAHGAYEVVNYE